MLQEHGTSQYGTGRVLGFFLTNEELIQRSKWSEDKVYEEEAAKGIVREPLSEEVKAMMHKRSGIKSTIQNAFLAYPVLKARSYVCERPFSKDRPVGYVIAFADDSSLWYKDSGFLPLMKELEQLRVNIGLPEEAKPEWHTLHPE